MNKRDVEEDIRPTKKRAKWGCFVWAFILVILPIALFIGYFIYEMNFKERTLVISYSPRGGNIIKVVEKGEAAWFGPSSVRIKYGWLKHIDRSLSNDGKKIDSSNVLVEWKNENEAIVTLYGEEQEPENVEITFSVGK